MGGGHDSGIQTGAHTQANSSINGHEDEMETGGGQDQVDLNNLIIFLIKT